MSIPNLLQNNVAEVAVSIDGHGMRPAYHGKIPEQLASLCRSNQSVYELVVEGMMNHDREPLVHAMMVDPLSAAVASPAEIRSMAEELFAAEKRFIPKWCSKAKRVAVKKPFATLRKVQKASVSSMADRDQ